MLRLAALLPVTACLACADLVLLNPAAPDAARLLAANEPDKAALSVFSVVQNKGAAVVQVACQPSDSYPGIAITPAKPWDLASHAWIEAELSNPGEHAVSVVLRIDNPGDWKSNPWNGEVVKIAPGQGARLRVWFGRSWGQPGFKLDPAQVVRALLFLSQPKEPGTFLVRRLTAGGRPGDKP